MCDDFGKRQDDRTFFHFDRANRNHRKSRSSALNGNRDPLTAGIQWERLSGPKLETPQGHQSRHFREAGRQAVRAGVTGRGVEIPPLLPREPIVGLRRVGGCREARETPLGCLDGGPGPSARECDTGRSGVISGAWIGKDWDSESRCRG